MKRSERPPTVNKRAVRPDEEETIRRMHLEGAQIKQIEQATGRVYRTIVATLKRIGLR